jgi:hypothetical protein
MKVGQKGQALIEFAYVCASLFVIVLLLGKLFKDEWVKCQCVYFAFERTQARLVGVRGMKPSDHFTVVENEKFIEGKGVCGRFSEVVRLPKLEYAEWN